ncbi:MAG: hypothetical protein ING44_11475 [Telmatospirillum sp.]|nr:hypothetical protein [Telmatospirillum sp.]
MTIRQITTEVEYLSVVREIEGLMSAKRGTWAGVRLDALVKFVEDWEAQRYCLEDSMLQKS